MTELKSCPFCGGQADTMTPEADDMRAATVMCMGCYCTGKECETEAQAIAAWNRRVSQAAPATPGAMWREDGLPDPHGTRYDCDRAKLAMGDLTDDELANAVFMHGDNPPDFREVLAGTAKMPIAYLTAATDRIRWLSRQLAAQAAPAPSDGLREALEAVMEALAAYRQRAKRIDFNIALQADRAEQKARAA